MVSIVKGLYCIAWGHGIITLAPESNALLEGEQAAERFRKLEMLECKLLQYICNTTTSAQGGAHWFNFALHCPPARHDERESDAEYSDEEAALGLVLGLSGASAAIEKPTRFKHTSSAAALLDVDAMEDADDSDEGFD
jgi:hypothetical protein